MVAGGYKRIEKNRDEMMRCIAEELRRNDPSEMIQSDPLDVRDGDQCVDVDSANKAYKDLGRTRKIKAIIKCDRNADFKSITTMKTTRLDSPVFDKAFERLLRDIVDQARRDGFLGTL